MSERDRMEAVINDHPDHLYTYSPAGTDADRRYVFTDRTCTTVSEAYLRAGETPATTEGAS